MEIPRYIFLITRWKLHFFFNLPLKFPHAFFSIPLETACAQPSPYPTTGFDFSGIGSALKFSPSTPEVNLVKMAKNCMNIKKLTDCSQNSGKHGMKGQANYFLGGGMWVSPYLEKPPCPMNFF